LLVGRIGLHRWCACYINNTNVQWCWIVLLKDEFNTWVHSNGVLKRREKMVWRREELNEFNIVEAWRKGHLAHFCWWKPAHASHAQTSSASCCRTRREKCFVDKVCDTCNILIGCLDFYHLNNLNSIISL